MNDFFQPNCAIICLDLQMTLPNNLRKRKTPAEYHLRFFVGFLFLLIIFTVSFSHVYYYQQVLQVPINKLPSGVLIKFFVGIPSSKINFKI